mmetsp:Transcript_14973/g.23173  ORF Transcript_14973/g.23173 Transcript_14973/m.23173 type:complete len:119 (+) Transcript_14973:5321-5677(+)
MELEAFVEAPPEPDPRPAPVLQRVKVFTNSSVRVKFNEPIVLRTDDPLEIYSDLESSFSFRIIAGSDGSEYLFKPPAVEDLAPPEPEVELTPAELEAKQREEMVSVLFDRIKNLSANN